jgi:ubiquinone biosynthesis protein
LEDHVLAWHRSLGADRDRIVEEAQHLATPRLARLPLVALVVVLIKFVWYTLTGAARRLAGRRGPGRARVEPAVRRAQHLVRAGGPAYVKLGQLIATAKGALPDPWTEAFAWCRDEVPPLRPGVAERVMDRSLGRRRAETFE